MSLPSRKTHRRNPRRLGMGQYPRFQPVTITVLGVGATAVLRFTRPIIVTSEIGITIAGNTIISQSIDTPQQITLTLAHDPEGANWTFHPNPESVRPYTGGIVAPAQGAFYVDPNFVLSTAGGNYFPPPASVVELGVQFGVANTSETGTFPGAPTLAHINTAGFLFPSFYEVTFDQPVTASAPQGTTEPALLFFSPTLNSWISILFDATISGTVLQFDATGTALDFTMVMLATQPSTFSANSADGFELGNPKSA